MKYFVQIRNLILIMLPLFCFCNTEKGTNEGDSENRDTIRVAESKEPEIITVLDSNSVDIEKLTACVQDESSYYSYDLIPDELTLIDTSFFKKYLSGFDLPGNIYPVSETKWYYYQLHEKNFYYVLSFIGNIISDYYWTDLYFAAISKENLNITDVKRVGFYGGDPVEGWFEGDWIHPDTFLITNVDIYVGEVGDEYLRTVDSVTCTFAVNQEIIINKTVRDSFTYYGNYNSYVMEQVSYYEYVLAQHEAIDPEDVKSNKEFNESLNFYSFKDDNYEEREILYKYIAGREPDFDEVFYYKVYSSGLLVDDNYSETITCYIGNFSCNDGELTKGKTKEEVIEHLGTPRLVHEDFLIYAVLFVDPWDESETFEDRIKIYFVDNRLEAILIVEPRIYY